MTTANKPTWNPVKAGSAQFLTGGQHTQQFSSRDMPGQLTLKVRQPGQGTQDEIARMDLRRKLEEKESLSSRSSTLAQKIREKEAELTRMGEAAGNGPTEELAAAASKYDDNDFEADGGAAGAEDVAEDSEEEEDSEGEEELLMRELERIKQEREEERLQEERRRQEEEQKSKQEAALKGNPLMDVTPGSAKLKRRWDDDVVFRNQTKTEVHLAKKRFINDTIRSDFHRKFLAKFVR